MDKGMDLRVGPGLDNGVGLEDNGDDEQEDSTVRREKREVSPSSSVGSRGDRSRKKKKSRNYEAFGGDIMEKVFNKGKLNEENASNFKKIERKSINKAMKVATRVGTTGLGENKKGISDIYMEYYKEARDINEIFRFGSIKDGVVESS
nr:RNA-directed DNA polymerase, eukaryota [Tanacetum cinerariifolium]